jgi:molybdopterin converting factor small subunit
LAEIYIRFGSGICCSSKKSLQMEIEKGTTVKKILYTLTSEYDLNPMIKISGLNESTPNLLILLNGKNIAYLKGEETPLNDGDKLEILTLLVGG